MNLKQTTKPHRENAQQPTPDQTPETMDEAFSPFALVYPTPDHVMRLQRTIGNVQTQHLLNRRLQREIAGGKTGGGVSATGVKISWDRSHKFPARTYGLAKFQFDAGVSASVDLSWGKKPVNIGMDTKDGSEAGLKVQAQLWKAKADKEADEKEEIFSSLGDHFEIVGVDLEVDPVKHSEDAAKDERKKSIGAAIVVTLKSGDKHKIFFNALEAVTKGDETDITVASAGVDVSFQILSPRFLKAALEHDLTVKGGLGVKGKVTISPNWPAVGAALAQRLGPSFLGQAFRAAAVGGGWLPSGLIAGGVETIRGYYNFIQEMHQLKELRSKTGAAVPGYATGFMKGLGVAGYNGGDAEWADYGQARGQAALGVGLAEMKKRLAVMAQSYGVEAGTITDEELNMILKEAVQQNAQQIYNSLYGAVNFPIRMLYYNKYAVL